MSKTENLTGYDITGKTGGIINEIFRMVKYWFENYVKPTHKIRTFDMYR